jgi:hypothetical protein
MLASRDGIQPRYQVQGGDEKGACQLLLQGMFTSRKCLSGISKLLRSLYMN